MGDRQGIPLPVPLGGVRADLVSQDLPSGYLWRAQNMVTRWGELRTRPGLQPDGTAGIGVRPAGGQHFKTAAGVDRIVAASLTKWKSLSGTTWTDISGAVSFTGDATNPHRFAVFPQAGVNYLLGVNNVDGLYSWDGAAAAISAVGGAPPSTARDITVAADYVVVGNIVVGGNRYGSRVAWSGFNNFASWDTVNNVADLADTNDNIVAVRQIGRAAFMVYKDTSLWIATAQAGLAPFRFDVLEPEIRGPATPACVVRAGQSQFYLATDGRIYQVTALGVTAISPPVDRFLQDTGLATYVRLVNLNRAWGVFWSADRSVWFFYPSVASPDPTVAVSYHLDTGAFHFHAFASALGAGFDGDDIATLAWSDLTGTWAAIGPGSYPSWDAFGGTLSPSIFAGDLSGAMFRLLYDQSDNGTSIAQSWEFALKAWPGLNFDSHVEGIESFFAQTPGGPTVTVQVGTSPALAEFPSDPPYATLGSGHDTSTSARQKLTGVAVDGRFVSMKYSVTSITPVKYRGALAIDYPQEAAS